MLGRQRREVVALAVREREARVRVDAANARLRRAKARFLANPVNLLLPYAAGALGGALVTRRRRPVGDGGRRREAIAWEPLLKIATTLWGLSLPLREALLDARAADVPPTGAEVPTGSASTPPPKSAPRPEYRPETRSGGRPDVARPPAARQPAPPA